MTALQIEKKAIRQNIIRKRSALSHGEQQQKSLIIIRQIIKDPYYLKAQKIALYWPHQGEVDPRLLLEDLWKKNKQCYLPVLDPKRDHQLLFVPYCAGDPLKKNRYGIFEPDLQQQHYHQHNHQHQHILDPHVLIHKLNLVLVPLVAFDLQGTRLGSGQGYYDRTFSFLKKKLNTPPGEPLNSHSATPETLPRLLGLAYDFQKVDDLPHDDLDIPLSGVVTESKLIWF